MRRGSDNATGDIPFIAPMKIKYLKSMSAIDRRRLGVAMSFLACLSLTLTSSVAQLKTRRVTGLQLGAAAEGSRVTVVSDSPLNDYEAFRRGDRFYVKIPLADFMSGLPQFRADGFENVQVQKVGEGLVVSFKLQPGATARINQYGNRLDVIFSAPNRVAFSNTASSGSTTTTAGNSGSSSNRGPDAAGPTPESSSSRERFIVNESPATGRSNGNPFFRNSRRSNATGNKGAAGANAAAAVASPIPSPATSFSPAPYTSYPPLTTATPVSSGQTAVSAGSSNWSNRRAAVIRWMSANRLATLLGALIVLSLIFYLVSAALRRKKNGEQTKGAKAKVQPKYSPNEKLDELPSAAAVSAPLSSQASAMQPPASSVSSVSAPAQAHPPVLTRPTIVSPSTSADEHREQSSDEEREVFEL
jgi:hypothetical protein